MRRAGLVALVACSLAVTAGCGDKAEEKTDTGGQGGGTEQVSLGFSQVGSESSWRVANTKSVQDSAVSAGIALDFQDGKQQQENQITAIRGFVQKKVDVIAFSPIVESGWDAVLQEAKDAKIPVILTDRAIDTTDTSLYRTLLGSDFVAEGRKAGQWLVDRYRGRQDDIKIVQIEGTTGSAPANHRRVGFTEAIESYPHLKVIDSKDGEFTREGGERVMKTFLAKHKDIDVVYAHNDEEGLGAIDALEAAGKKPGEDVLIITVDASRGGLEALAAGKLNFVVECNPLLGPQLMDLVKKAAAGETLPTRVVTDETVFDQAKAKEVLPTRQY
ncbi:LacI family transcriptional regulator [Paractinoplanes rishiriensis]|uniref:LacI family transcriptional regulator n=2 Tax=Paractinoplanes rishiriensis TaxID=1050105 RepID=A0A919K5V1_9ACTN|nr:LacI family transcriptional regulator [Actinoplanes rishiriensis]